ncbi:hypothetical protein ESB00_04895 [Oleiharenicola lentus]|jgi:hypothetical protein|uniref:Outer membrane protein assembly factor BamE n=1 Tax=Oleiharenicola lentus TaxID=2508720 RepID=A0A4Q1C8G0_9BACT|nr:hypothetical protein [Oleiharenicola lentus]RXK55237.1 hypothetical protein ESB00_04895 [Oleiharenicola lentus]
MSANRFTLRSLAPWLALAALLLAGCYREVTDESAMARRPRYTGTSPWTVDGVRPGDRYTAIRERLGEPRDDRPGSSGRIATWNYGQLTVAFDREDRATEVMGQSIRAGNDTVITTGIPEAEVVQVLGHGETQKTSRPTGSGVIAIGRTHTHTTHLYENGGVRFEVSVKFPEDSVANIWARWPEPASR